jgi:hypothetical protein
MRGNHTFKFFKVLPVLALALCSTAAFAGNARCFLHGIIQPINDNKEKSSLSDMIRINFDVTGKDEQPKCEAMLLSYCAANVKGKDYSPTRLKASFTPDIDKSETVNFHFNEKCKLISDD